MPAAQVDAVEIQLENLALAQKHLEHQGERSFLGLAREGARVRQIQRPRELLRDRAAALRPGIRPEIGQQGPTDRDGVDARMQVEAVVLDGDDRVLEVGRNLVELDVPPLLVQRKPFAAGRVVKHRVADARIELVDGQGVAARPQRRQRRWRRG